MSLLSVIGFRLNKTLARRNSSYQDRFKGLSNTLFSFQFSLIQPISKIHHVPDIGNLRFGHPGRRGKQGISKKHNKKFFSRINSGTLSAASVVDDLVLKRSGSRSSRKIYTVVGEDFSAYGRTDQA